MSKRVLRLVSILFLSSILVLSCSNANKTGSDDNNSGNGGTGTGGDGGTTPQGIAKYAGTWTAKFTDVNSYDVIIGTDGKVTIDDGSATKKEATDIKKEAENKYTMTVQHTSDIEASTVTITFDNETSGSINDSDVDFGNGVIRKQNGGNKGLWYYEGNWNFQETNGTGKGTIVIGGDGSVTFEIKQKPYTSKNVVNKGSETYEAKFVDEDPNGEISSTLILTLTFNSDNKTGSYEVKIIDTNTQETQIKNGTLTKQQ